MLSRCLAGEYALIMFAPLLPSPSSPCMLHHGKTAVTLQKPDAKKSFLLIQGIMHGAAGMMAPACACQGAEQAPVTQGRLEAAPRALLLGQGRLRVRRQPAHAVHDALVARRTALLLLQLRLQAPRPGMCLRQLLPVQCMQTPVSCAILPWHPQHRTAPKAFPVFDAGCLGIGPPPGR